MTKPANGTNVGNAIHELAPGTTWRLDAPGEIENLEWLDDPQLRPTDAVIAAKTAELDAAWPAVQQAQADSVAARDAAKQSAIDKLAALGLTVDEISAAFGLEGS